MNRGRIWIVALTRFHGVVMVFYGIFYATYLGPYYDRFVTVYENPALHEGIARTFWAEILHVVVRVGCGLIIVAKAEKIIDTLRPPEAVPGFRSLVVALVKLDGFLLLLNGGILAVDLAVIFSNSARFGWHEIVRGGPAMLRFCLNLLAGFLAVACAEKIIDGLAPREVTDDPADVTTQASSAPRGKS